MPWLNIITLVFVLGLTLIWAIRGTGRGIFSSFLAMIATIAAGAIAFGLWQKLAIDVFMDFREPFAYTLGLVVPFGVALIGLRLITDVYVRANLQVGEAGNFIGGAVFGFVSSIITVGVFVVGIAHLPTGPSLLGYAPLKDKAQSVEYGSPLWLPVDTLTIKLYEHLSVSSFSTTTPLAVYNPDAHRAAGAARNVLVKTQDNTKHIARTIIRPEQVTIETGYLITGSANDLLIDRAQGEVVQPYTEPSGDSPSGPQQLLGYVITFGSGSGESSGQFLLARSQARLVIQNSETGETKNVYSIAIIAPADTEAEELTRFAVPAEPNSSIGSSGGQTESTWGIEFLAPAGWEPIAMYIKNTHIDGLPALDDHNKVASTELRDDMLSKNEFLVRIGGGGGSYDDSRARELDNEDINEAISITNRIPGNFSFLTREARGLKFIEGDRGSTLQSGSQLLRPSAFETREVGQARNLVVRFIEETSTTRNLFMEIVSGVNETEFGQAIRENTQGQGQPIKLVDVEGNEYLPVGYFHNNGENTQITFTPSSPIEDGLPVLSLGNRDIQLTLIFRVTQNKALDRFVIGEELVFNFEDPLEVSGGR